MFYERFIQLCDESNEKPTNVLKGIGVSSGNLNNWKNGTSVKSDILMQLSEHFNVSVDYLLGRTDEPKTINQINTGDVGNNSNVNINKSSFSDTDNELISEFKKLTFNDKAKVMSLIAELSEKKA